MDDRQKYRTIQVLLESAITMLIPDDNELTSEQDKRIWRCINEAIAACHPPVKNPGSDGKERPITPLKTDRVDYEYKPESDWHRT